MGRSGFAGKGVKYCFVDGNGNGAENMERLYFCRIHTHVWPAFGTDATVNPTLELLIPRDVQRANFK